MKPRRIQRKRTKGWRMPPNTIYVGRPSKWGNPFIVDEKAVVTNRAWAYVAFEEQIKTGWSSVPPRRWPKGKIPSEWTTIEDVKRELRGKNLACWCPLDQMCHADILLKIANAPD